MNNTLFGVSVKFVGNYKKRIYDPEIKHLYHFLRTGQSQDLGVKTYYDGGRHAESSNLNSRVKMLGPSSVLDYVSGNTNLTGDSIVISGYSLNTCEETWEDGSPIWEVVRYILVGN